jgi:hypothetical protein
MHEAYLPSLLRREDISLRDPFRHAGKRTSARTLSQRGGPTGPQHRSAERVPSEMIVTLGGALFVTVRRASNVSLRDLPAPRTFGPAKAGHYVLSRYCLPGVVEAAGISAIVPKKPIIISSHV